MPEQPGPDAVHLGDGAYATCDGWYTTLWAKRDGGWHMVALEPEGILALVQYAKRSGVDLGVDR
jgi:hypothetical protein